MLIPPVHSTTPSLDDASAAPPDGLPERKALRKALSTLTDRIDELQRALYAEREQALLVVLQARDAGGKDGTIRRVFGRINPQGCVVTSFGPPSELERRHDFLWRVHKAVPPAGIVGVFNRSHYEDVLVVRVRELAPREVWSPRYEQIAAFERLLHQNRVTILKFMLHVSRDEQRRRLLRRLEDPGRNWKFNPGDIDDRNHWDDYTDAYRDALTRTSTDDAPWFVIPADDKRSRDYLVASRVADTLERMDPRYPVGTGHAQRYIEALG